MQSRLTNLIILLYIYILGFTAVIKAFYFPLLKKRAHHLYELFDGDVVTYSDGNVTKIGAAVISGKSKMIAPLGIRIEEDMINEDEIYLYELNDANLIPLDEKNISQISIVKETIYTQRMIEDRVSNPHGEHAENVWILSAEIFKQLQAKPNIRIDIDEGH